MYESDLTTWESGAVNAKVLDEKLSGTLRVLFMKNEESSSAAIILPPSLYILHIFDFVLPQKYLNFYFMKEGKIGGWRFVPHVPYDNLSYKNKVTDKSLIN